MVGSAVIEVDQETYGVLSRISPTVAGIFAFCILLHHIYSLNNHSKKYGRIVTSQIFAGILILFSLFQNLVFTVIAAYADLYNESACRWVVAGGGICYALSKWSLYMTLTFRIGIFKLLIIYTIYYLFISGFSHQ